MVAVSQLNDEQREKLGQYQTITQINDIEEALGQLIEHNWHLERAIQHVYDDNNSSIEEKREELEHEVATSTATAATTVTVADNDLRNRTNTATTISPSTTNAGTTRRDTSSTLSRNQLTSSRRPPFLFTLLFWPLGLAWNLTWSLLSFATRLFSNRPTITHRQQAQKKRDPRVLAMEFIQEFEAKYGTQHIEFFKGGYSQALEKARKDVRFMLVLLHSDDHDDTDTFCRNVLTSTQLIDFINDNNILVWPGNVRETEAHKVANTLQAATFPFMALIALQQPRIGSSSTTPKMGIIERVEGMRETGALTQQLRAAMDRHGAIMNRLQHERKQRELERQLLSDQDKAYRESLKADQEKARKAREEKERQEKLKLEKVEKQQQKEAFEAKRQQYIRYLSTHLTPEPEGKDGVVRISFRLADGDRVVRKFSKNDTLESLYRFVEAYPLLKDDSIHDTVESAPEHYEHQYRFTIVSPYPRMEYEPDGTKELHTISSLWPSATLVVDAVDDEDDDEIVTEEATTKATTA